MTLNVSHMVVGATLVLSFSQTAADLLWIPTLANPCLKTELCGGRWLVAVRGQRSEWAVGQAGDRGRSQDSSFGAWCA